RPPPLELRPAGAPPYLLAAASAGARGRLRPLARAALAALGAAARGGRGLHQHPGGLPPPGHRRRPLRPARQLVRSRSKARACVENEDLDDPRRISQILRVPLWFGHEAQEELGTLEAIHGDQSILAPREERLAVHSLRVSKR